MSKLLLYYSGEENKGNPEIVLQDKANVMFTFFDVHKNKGKLPVRMKRVFKKRKKQVEERELLKLKERFE